MEVLKDFRFWAFIIGCLNFIGVIIVGCFHWFSHNKIVGNDLHHLALDLKDIKGTQKEQGEKIDTLVKDYAGLSARCEERHSKK